ncbi:MAG TPA: extracellular solute-binding protein [Acidimicrobiia bacterium]|nr:extracellular solute-binding protein [Acidimicrobiia bacterium]
MKHLIALCLVGAFLVSACAGASDDEGPLVVYSGRGEELVAPLLETFTAETGIEVEVRYGGSNELAATLIAEGEETEADVFFAQDPADLGSVAPMMSVLSDETLDLVDPKFRDRDGHWVGTSGRVRVVVYNTGTEIPLPQTIDDVTDPAWSSQLGIAPTNGSFLAFVAAMILERGEDGTRQWLEALAANDPVDFEGNAPIVEATDNGELEGGLVNHYYLLRRRAEGLGQNAENHFIPAGDVGSLVMPAGVGILSATARPEAAQEFVDFLLGSDAQSFFATDLYEYPMIQGVDSPEGIPALAEINAPDIDLSELAGVLDLATRLVAEAGLV